VKKHYLNKFIQKYKTEYQEEITEEDALKRAEQLLALYRAIFGELTELIKNNHDQNQ
jgi:hypothetical protein